MSLVDPPAAEEPGPRRAQVLARLREAQAPLSVTEVAKLAELHPNTARFHLDGLVEDGLAERSVEPRATPGRRRVLYAARRQARGTRSYALLAEMLTGLVASLGAAEAQALAAGRAWGRHLVQRPTPSERLAEEESVQRLDHLLGDIGFEPETRPAPDGADDVDLRLHHCPFREVAERHTDVVCAIHLGLMQGALGELRSSWEAASLHPFVEPTLCVARLRRRTA